MIVEGSGSIKRIHENILTLKALPTILTTSVWPHSWPTHKACFEIYKAIQLDRTATASKIRYFTFTAARTTYFVRYIS